MAYKWRYAGGKTFWPLNAGQFEEKIMIRLRPIHLRIVIIALLLLVWVLPTQSQEFADGQLVYTRQISEGFTEIVVVFNETRLALTIQPSECFSLSRNLDLVAVSQKQNPENIRIIALETQAPVQTIDWQIEWTSPCTFSWVDDNRLLIIDQERPLALLDARSSEGLIEDAASLAELSSQPLTDQEIDALPNLLTFSGLPQPYIMSPDSRLILYQSCPNGIARITTSGLDTCASPEYHIYDTSSASIVETLSYYPSLDRDPIITFPIYFSWSPSGRYLAFKADRVYNPVTSSQFPPSRVMIYDILEDRYINAIGESEFVLSDEQSLLLTYPMYWSPDEQNIAFWFDAQGVGPDTATNLIFGYTGIESEELITITREFFDIRPDRWRWMLDSSSVAILERSGDLIELGLDGSTRLLDTNVERLFQPSWRRG